MAAVLREDARLWRAMNRAELDRAYNNSEAVADSAARLTAMTERSRQFRAQHCNWLDLRYGERERNRIDLFRCGRTDAPLLVFIHGGYWQRNNKEMFACLAAGPLSAGFDVAMIGYTLCPDIAMSDLVDEIEMSIVWLRLNAAQMGIGISHILVSGWSAGAHLAATIMSRVQFDGALLISGIYDLTPCRLNYLNSALQLTATDVHRFSPINHVVSSICPMTIAYGSEELPELRRQSVDYSSRLRGVGAAPTLKPLVHNHFSILTEYENRTGKLVLALEKMVA
ncbi:alpha/beta hydrolase [Brucella grignonensis]|uniref:Alpha/beta hydrolase fold family protein n=1 Tax=Brucella grignonensis TaxID=94627 RepID=A0A256G3D2_9HYPH|nr:alpha/beta hydrolase [Brucella grignonensis]OYR21490.1 alpha/beta hydrolase fold family protein [Brucella grignonensis]